MVQGVRRGFQHLEGTDAEASYSQTPRPRQAVRSRNRRFGLGYGRTIRTTRRTRSSPPSRFLFEGIPRTRAQLPNTRQGAHVHHLGLQGMETLAKRNRRPRPGIFRSQESHVVHDLKGTQPKTNAMVRVPVTVQLHDSVPKGIRKRQS
ncbi:hypothetical protein SMAC4_13516 [Sordaria macrospora]|uniref:uncharacterized protein n=1 Tax=Sordaria macrospora TaxID=5147 RepID=UPI002B284E7B|nr:hypothetical protein SMAC4_13516 [Sordaria macrospora]